MFDETIVDPVVVQALEVVESGAVINQVTAPVGCAYAPATPETVVVKVVVPCSEGLAEAESVITGGCAVRVTETWLLAAAE